MIGGGGAGRAGGRAVAAGGAPARTGVPCSCSACCCRRVPDLRPSGPRGHRHLRRGAGRRWRSRRAAPASWAGAARRGGARGSPPRAIVACACCGWPWAPRVFASSAAAASPPGSRPALAALRDVRGPARRCAPHRRPRAAGDLRVAPAGRAAAAAIRRRSASDAQARRALPRAAARAAARLARHRRRGSCCARSAGSTRPMWWALEQIHLSREQVVDQLVMARTPARRAYMDALLQFADAPAMRRARPSRSCGGGTCLTSCVSLSKEPHMTRLRLASRRRPCSCSS